ncbi:hypothetical protein CVO77_08945 [Sphingopyxis lindanitolerans]|uniref:DUF3426 domain-containing protein n=1 Tax=Sphingopyxis lindanitolerans TaxID=2054227 RepID=A0A2S8B899_9SPHN|nr:hypothetical protein [Sphingopyxis lindanitolerans]PQM28560.1 hypothetical protein CVO77_08945 [Sphingopyxis lindanitolerans]
MTVRTIGRRERAAGLSLAALAASLMLGGLPPVAAQTDQPTPAPTPAPSSTFRLPPADDGRASGVQGPSDNGLPPLAPGERRGPQTPAPTPTPTPPVVVPTRPATPTPTPAASAPAARREPPPAPGATARAASEPATSAPVSAAPVTAAPESAAPAVEAPSPATPGFSVDPTAPVPGSSPDEGAAPATDGNGNPPLWAWLLAGLVAAGVGLWYWRRRPVLADDASSEFEAPPPAPRTAGPVPAPRPQPAAPVAPRVPSPSIPSPLVMRPMAERRAQVAMALDIRGIRMTSEQLIVAFTLNLRNEGPIAASGLLIRIALNQGAAMTEPVLARFFDGAGGSILRDDMILAPGAGEQIATEVMLPRAAVEPLMIGGKPMLIPVLVFDVTYHWDGEGDAFGQNAGSFVLGREQGASGSEKLAPLPLDHPNLVVNRPGARTTAIRRSQ